MQKLKIQKPDGGKIPQSVITGLFSEEGKKINTFTTKSLVSTDCKEKLSKLKFTLHVYKGYAIFNLKGIESVIHFPAPCASGVAVGMISDMIELSVAGGWQNDNTEVVVPTVIAVDPASPIADHDVHEDIAAEVTGKATGVPQLGKATEFYQQVKGSSGGSRYVYLATNGKTQLAIRLRDGGAVSVRMEPFDTTVKGEAELLGLTDNGSYASCHLQCPTDLVLARYVAMLKTLLTDWDVATWNKNKIKQLGV